MKYWAYINNEIKGPFEKDELLKLEGFNNSTLVCPQSPIEEDTKEWKEASNFPELVMGDAVKSTEKEEKAPDALTLDVSLKKEDIMIERFSINNIFSSNTEPQETKFSSTDPLSLSQIRKRGEEISQRITPSNVGNEKKEDVLNIQDKISEPDTVNLEKDSQNTELSLNISLPDTESILNSESQSQTKLPEDDIKPYDLPELKKEVEEIKPEVVEFKNNPPEEMKVVTEEIKTDNSFNESYKKENTIPELKTPSFDLSGLKTELEKDIEKKISDISNKNVSKEELDLFKEEIKKYISEKLSEVPSVSNADTINHLDIEVRDIKVRLEIIEKNISDLSKLKEQPSSSNLENTTKTVEVQNDPAKTVVIKKEETDKKEKKQLDVGKFIKPVVYLILIILVVLSLGFALKQFGIFDFTKFFEKSAPPKVDIKNEDPVSGSLAQNVVSTFNAQGIIPSTQTNQSIDLNSGPLGENQNTNSTQTVQNQNQYDGIINEVREYRINTDKNLENTIIDVIKSRKGDISTLKWLCEQVDLNYVITATANAGGKEIIFKFEYEPKTKILKPLNTLSVNTLKMMMTTKKTNKAEKKAVSRNKLLKPSSKDVNEKKEVEKENTPVETQKKSEQSEDEYLIIGE